MRYFLHLIYLYDDDNDYYVCHPANIYFSTLILDSSSNKKVIYEIHVWKIVDF